MERNEATAKPVAWPSCAWLQLSFFPFPVGNPMSAGCMPMALDRGRRLHLPANMQAMIYFGVLYELKHGLPMMPCLPLFIRVASIFKLHVQYAFTFVCL